MNATKKNIRAASDLIQAQSQLHPASLLARIMDLEEVAKEALADLRKKEADALAKAAEAAKEAVESRVETIASLRTRLAALESAKPAPSA